MPYVKLDCGILDSTIWPQKAERDVFITALLMAKPHEVKETIEAIECSSLKLAGWSIPPGWYGMVEASGPGIVDRAKVDEREGMIALLNLCSPEPESRSPEFDGRRLGRVPGGYIVLNFQKYRDKDHTAAARSARYRQRQRNAVALQSHAVTPRSVTQAEAEAEAEAEADQPPAGSCPILSELQAHPVLRYCDHERMAEQIAGYQIANGKPLEWHLDAIRWVAATATGAELAGDPWPPAKIGEKLLSVTRSPNKPREGDAAPGTELVADPCRTPPPEPPIIKLSDEARKAGAALILKGVRGG